ncbi:MAG TPA: hypothetical protein VND87_13140 [Stellaceae bacterium]|nr:hypothetical protein [Stellaceae bacterium]
MAHEVNLWAIRSKFTNDEMSGRFAAFINEVNTGQRCAIRMCGPIGRNLDRAVVYSGTGSGRHLAAADAAKWALRQSVALSIRL